MPIIRFAKNLPEVHAAEGATLMDALREAGLPVASSCQGDGVCAKCRVHVISGLQNLSPEDGNERRLRARHGFARTVRVSCQAKIHGDVMVDTSYW